MMNQPAGPVAPDNPPNRRGASWAYSRWGAGLGAALQGYWIVTSVYLVVEVGLSPLQLLLLGTALELTILVAEVPTGVMADTVSRRRSIRISMVLMAMAFVVTGSTTSFPVLLLANVLWGFGYTFTSGADVAWASDEVLAEGGDEEQVDRTITAKARWQQWGGAVGLLGFGLLGFVTSLSTAIYAAGALMLLLALWVTFRFDEHGFDRTAADDGRGTGQAMQILRAGLGLVRHSRVVSILLAVTLLFNLGAEAMDRLTELRLTELGLPDGVSPILFFTGLGMIGLLAGAALLRLIEPKVARSRQGPRLVYGSMALVAALGALLVALAPVVAVGAAGVFITRGLAWSVLPVVGSVWINRITGSRTRATVQSFLSQAISAGQIIGGLMLGAIAAAAGGPAAIATSAGLFAVSGVLILVTGQSEDHSAEPEPTRAD